MSDGFNSGMDDNTNVESKADVKVNVLAVVSFVCSAFGLVFLITSWAGIITGHIALTQIKHTGERGRGIALAGVIIGYAVNLIVVLSIAYLVSAIVRGPAPLPS